MAGASSRSGGQNENAERRDVRKALFPARVRDQSTTGSSCHRTSAYTLGSPLSTEIGPMLFTSPDPGTARAFDGHPRRLRTMADECAARTKTGALPCPGLLLSASNAPPA